jgi:hypothetical protein
VAVRCPRCARSQSEEARACRDCGADLMVGPVALVADPPVPQLGRRRSVRPRFRRAWMVGAACLLLVVGAVAFGHRHRMSKPTGALLVSSVEGSRFAVEDLDALTRYVLNPPGSGNEFFPVLGVGTGVVIVRNGLAFGISNLRPKSAATALLGPATDLVASNVAGHVWLVSSGGRIREVDLTGRLFTPPTSLPANFQLDAAIDQGLVLERGPSGSGLLVWDPMTARTIREVGRNLAPVLLGAAGNWIVWREGSCRSPCAAHVTDLRSGTDRTVASLPYSVSYRGVRPQISADGHFLALTLTRLTDAGPEFRLGLIDTIRATLSVVADGPPAGYLLWSPSGHWLFASDGNALRAVSTNSRQVQTVMVGRFFPEAAIRG